MDKRELQQLIEGIKPTIEEFENISNSGETRPLRLKYITIDGVTIIESRDYKYPVDSDSWRQVLHSKLEVTNA